MVLSTFSTEPGIGSDIGYLTGRSRLRPVLALATLGGLTLTRLDLTLIQTDHSISVARILGKRLVSVPARMTAGATSLFGVQATGKSLESRARLYSRAKANFWCAAIAGSRLTSSKFTDRRRG